MVAAIGTYTPAKALPSSYAGINNEQHGFVVYRPDGVVLSPARSQKLRNLSPGGFAWGYMRSESEQLALAILLDYTNCAQHSLHLYHHFTREVIARIPPSESWFLSTEQLSEWIMTPRGEGLEKLMNEIEKIDREEPRD